MAPKKTIEENCIMIIFVLLVVIFYMIIDNKNKDEQRKTKSPIFVQKRLDVEPKQGRNFENYDKSESSEDFASDGHSPLISGIEYIQN